MIVGTEQGPASSAPAAPLTAEALAIAKAAALIAIGDVARAQAAGSALDSEAVRSIADKAAAAALEKFGLDPADKKSVAEFLDDMGFVRRWKAGARDLGAHVVKGLGLAAAMAAGAAAFKYGVKP